jgi:NAD(P)-dependent dehydrogenase (short-subunit alcohol dehydrogenase family)
MGLLDGKVAIVTGAGRGIGRTEALLLASEGAKVVVNDIGGAMSGEGSDQTPAQQVVDEIKAAGGDAAANYDSVTDFDGAGRMIDQAVDAFGGLDILVNNAGILRDKMSFNMDEADWDAVIAVHLRGTSAPAGTPPRTGGRGSRSRAARSTRRSSTPHRSRGSTETRASSTTRRRRRASRR